MAYESPPRGEEAENACRNGLRIAPQYSEFYYHLARALAAQGKFDDARKAISGMGDPETAIEFLDKALAQGFRDGAWLASSDHFAAVRALPAYGDLLRLIRGQ